MSQDPNPPADEGGPRNKVLFVGGVVFVTLGLGALLASAFVDSDWVNLLTALIVPGSIMTVYGWQGSDPSNGQAP